MREWADGASREQERILALDAPAAQAQQQ